MQITGDEYKKNFDLPSASIPDLKVDTAKSGKALRIALNIRKFEIGLYWKRAAYFWALLTGTLAGYFTLLVTNDPTANPNSTYPNLRAEGLLAISCLGLVISVAWYFVNRASKYWQENWEKHVDLLEDEHIGPLYKTVLNDEQISFLG